MYELKFLRYAYDLNAERVMISILKLAFDEIRAGYRDDQPRGPDGRWIIGRGNYVISRRESTGNKQIDSITDKILNVLDNVLAKVWPWYGASYGTFVHSSAANILREMNIPAIGERGIEQSFSFGDLVRYGLSDSVRTDVVLRNDNTDEILAVWDIKTSNERLRPKRVAKIRKNLNISDDVPVIEAHINLGINVKNTTRRHKVILH